MQTILIPTKLHDDTIDAVQTAINHAQNKKINIILFLISDEIDTISAAHYLREMKNQLTFKELEVLEKCRNLIANFTNSKIDFQRQYGISAPYFKKFLEHHAVDFIILSSSFVNSTQNVHQNLVRIIENQKKPILHLKKVFSNSLSNAIYLENTTSRLNLNDIQLYIEAQFPTKKISQVVKHDQENISSTQTALNEILAKNEIDFIIETRTIERNKIKKKKKQILNAQIDIPVLSLYEETL